MKVTALIFVVLFAALPMNGQKKSATAMPSSPTQTETSGRYQLIPAQVELGMHAGEALSMQLFLVDTQTGRVWRYQPSGVVGEGKGAVVTPEMFIPIEHWKKLSKDETLPQE
ncbi:MAG TPA: hypothetical protein VN950_25035 [Terriglobales bacterium]|nr:hypothetical protein [Terriglobales bacterium]